MLTAATRELARTALPVETVAALRRPCPHVAAAAQRYPVGLKANLLMRAYKWIPDLAWDWIVQRAMGLPKIKPP